MARTLGIKQNDVELLNKHYQSVIGKINSDKTSALKVANALYSDKGYPLEPEFVALCKKYYESEAHSIDFGAPATVATINSWCSKNTNGKIPNIINSLAGEVMALLNAIYFKGSWDKPFKVTDTKNETFTGAKSVVAAVKMMHKIQQLDYLKGDNFAAVCLPYKDNKQSMYVFLPDTADGLPALQAQFNEKNWNTWISSFRSNQVDLAFPKTKLDYGTLLNDSLTAMGMITAFQPKADFSKLCRNPVYISRVIQKTFMDINEEGTEAAAATAVLMAPRGSISRPNKVQFKVDHPFVLALVDNENNEILFLGSVLKP